MPLIDIILRLTLFACPVTVAGLALYRFRRSRSLNRPAYGLVLLTVVALILFTAPRLLFSATVPTGVILLALATAPLWLATIGVCALTRKSRFYERPAGPSTPMDMGTEVLMTAQSAHSTAELPDGGHTAYTRDFGKTSAYAHRAHPPAQDGPPDRRTDGRSQFRSRRLQTPRRGVTPAE